MHTEQDTITYFEHFTITTTADGRLVTDRRTGAQTQHGTMEQAWADIAKGLAADREAILTDAQRLATYAHHHARCAERRRAEAEAQQRAGVTGAFTYSCSCGLDPLLDRYFRLDTPPRLEP